MSRFVELNLESGCVLSINADQIAGVLKRPDGSVSIIYGEGSVKHVKSTDSYESVMKKIQNASEDYRNIRWIPVTEKLPDENSRVWAVNINDEVPIGCWIYKRGYSFLAYFEDAESGFRYYEDGDMPVTVTHWMPVPNHPLYGVS